MSVETCTLPTAGQPLRLAEFDELFAAARTVEAVSPTRSRMWLTGPPGLEAKVRDLTARETACCSFFTFTTTPAADGSLILDIEVPPRYADVLATLTDCTCDGCPIPSPAG